MRRNAVVGFTAAMLLATSAAAQQGSPRSNSIMFGPFVGMNYTTVYGSDVTNADSRMDFAVGGQLDFALSPNGLFRTGLVYSRRGAETTDQGVTIDLKISYLEVPLLLGYRFPTSGGVRPYVLGGAQVGFKVACKFEGSSGGVSASVGCDDPSLGTDFASTDIGVVGGAGLAFPMGLNSFIVDLRYTLGLQNIEKNSETKNRGFTLGAGVMIPVGR